MNKNYEFTGEVKTINNTLLKKIKRVSDNIPMGWIEFESNLSEEFEGYICENSNVYGKDTIISGDVGIKNSTIYNSYIKDDDLEKHDTHTLIENSRISNTKLIGKDNIIKCKNNCSIYNCELSFERVMIEGDYTILRKTNMDLIGCIIHNTKLYDFNLNESIKDVLINDVDNDLISIKQNLIDKHIFTRMSTYNKGDMYSCIGYKINSSGHFDEWWESEQEIIKHIARSLSNKGENKIELFEKYRRVIKEL